MIKDNQLAAIEARAEALQADMADQAQSKNFASLARAYAQLEPVLSTITQWRSLNKELAELQEVLQGEDKELAELAEAELPNIKTRLAETEQALQIALIPKDEADESNVIVELRAGTGGDEAALFAGDLCEMYQRYAGVRGWKFEILSQSQGEVGGIKEAVLELTGTQVFAAMKYESGVHRVQRVPATESSGRIHTSAATVAVLPEPKDVDIDIAEKDLRVDVFRASGPGGQSVNTTDSAVRITHLPSGITVSQQDEKSQHKNRAKAMQILRARIYEEERNKQQAERAAERKAQVGSGDRSQRIRTYNFPQGRVTDHRIGLTVHKLQEILQGQGLDEIIAALQNDYQLRALAAMEEKAE